MSAVWQSVLVCIQCSCAHPRRARDGWAICLPPMQQALKECKWTACTHASQSQTPSAPPPPPPPYPITPSTLSFHLFPGRASSYMGLLHCPYCGKSYTSIGNLRVHFIDAHLNNGPFQCSMCHKVSRTRSGLRMHIQRHHRYKVN